MGTIYKNTEQWDSRELGATEEHVVKSSQESSDSLNDLLGLKAISIRLPQGMIDDLKAIAEINGLGYQPLIKQVLARFVRSEQKRLANEMIQETLAQRKADKGKVA